MRVATPEFCVSGYEGIGRRADQVVQNEVGLRRADFLYQAMHIRFADG